MSDLVSIVMPAHDLEDCIGASIRTVLAQTHREWELIVVDDASTDRTAGVAASFGDPRIRIVRNASNEGAGFSRSRALGLARGRWVAFLDGDDWWHPEKLERQLDFARRGGHAFACTDYRARIGGGWEPTVRTGPAVADRRTMLRYNYVFTGTILWDRERMGTPRVPALRKRNDYLLWLRASETAPCHRLSECLSFYIRRKGSLSNVARWKLLRWQYLLFRRGLGMPPARSLWHVGVNVVFGSLKPHTCARPPTPGEAARLAEVERVARGRGEEERGGRENGDQARREG